MLLLVASGVACWCRPVDRGKTLNWLSIVTGVILIGSVNVPGAYHKDRMPRALVRVLWTLAGLCFVYLGLRGLGVVP
jgi:hypothetical protein